jgi:chromosome segregation ATPase
MVRPLPLPDPHRSGTNGNPLGRPSSTGPFHLSPVAVDETSGLIDNLELLADDSRTRNAADAAEMEHLRGENAQLHALCRELEQALQEAAQQYSPDLGQQVREYESVLEGKNDKIRQLHQQLQELQAALEEAEERARQAVPPSRQQAIVPREDELLTLSEELERERRQLQEDEQALMEQMREMEVGMARERAELARQRNDLQRLQSEIRHDLERLERNGAVHSKIEDLKNRLQDATARRGAAPSRKDGLMGRLFGRGE